MIGRGGKVLIQVIDNFFTEEVHSKIFWKMNRPKWSFTGGNPFSPFWHINGLENEDYFNSNIFQLIQTKLNLNLKISRVYANGQTACQSGNPHRDDFDCDLTFLYYPNPVWKVMWGGNLIFFEDFEDHDKCDHDQLKMRYMKYDTSPSIKIKKCVNYVPNRAVIFPPSVWHQSLEPNRHFNGMRISLAYKLQII